MCGQRDAVSLLPSWARTTVAKHRSDASRSILAASASLTYERFGCRIPHDCVQRFHAPAEKLIPIRFVSLSIRVSSLALSVSAGKVGSPCVVAGSIRGLLLLFHVKAPSLAAAAAGTGRRTDTPYPPSSLPLLLPSFSSGGCCHFCFKDTACRRPSSRPLPHLCSPLLSSAPEHHRDTGRDLFNYREPLMRVSRSARSTSRREADT